QPQSDLRSGSLSSVSHGALRKRTGQGHLRNSGFQLPPKPDRVIIQLFSARAPEVDPEGKGVLIPEDEMVPISRGRCQ
ncbi:MAG TPA: hypothetical protein VEL06_09995, partial [Haliangiales bacterium]|nr:hypothetical protein [Haliangiales bacterium]